jgi:hypothetical protein
MLFIIPAFLVGLGLFPAFPLLPVEEIGSLALNSLESVQE